MKIVKKYEQILTYNNYAKRTIEVYSCYLQKFLEEGSKNPYHITTKDIVDYLHSQKYSSISKQNQVIGSLKLFAKLILGKKDVHISKITRPRKQRKVPKIINAELLAKKIKAVENVKHKAILTLGLSCGLRVSEVVNLRWQDLDRNRNIINIKNAKGRKDRCVPLNDGLILLLEKYWYTYKTKNYVFAGQSSNKYSAASIQKIVKKHIGKKATFHLLRHSYATYAVDNGTELKPLSVSLGHNSTKTTEIYYHASIKTLKTIKQAI